MCCVTGHGTHSLSLARKSTKSCWAAGLTHGMPEVLMREISTCMDGRQPYELIHNLVSNTCIATPAFRYIAQCWNLCWNLMC